VPTHDPLLAHLNAEQRDAVLSIDGALLVVAGAGTGKTRTITHRIAHMIRCGVPPSAILAVTFTNKAAREMRGRVAALAGDGAVRVHTFHGFAASFLRAEFPVIGRSGDFTIYDEADSVALMKRVLQEMKLEQSQWKPGPLLHRIGRWKEQLITQEEAARGRTGTDAVVVDAWARYDAALLKAEACDFDDLLLQTLRILLNEDSVRMRWQRRIERVLVDEFQDTNQIQYALVRALSMGTGHLCVTGDQDQSIYSWRGADPSNFDRFLTDHPDARVVRLEENYRSSGNILGAASRLIAFNKRRIPKTLRTSAAAGEPVRIVVFQDDQEEARALAGTVEQLLREGTNAREITIAYRTNSLSLPVERALMSRGIAYEVLGGLEFFARTEVKDLLAWLRWTANPKDVVSCQRVMNVPPRGLGDGAREKLESLAAAKGQTLPELLRGSTEIEGLPERTRKAALACRALLASVDAARCQSPGVRKLAEKILELTGYDTWWRTRSEKAGSLDPFGNIGQLLSLASEFDEHTGGSLADFLSEVGLLTDLDRDAPETPRVNLMTLHTAKGLEFEHVFIIGVDYGILPHFWSELEERDDEEERRLLHVGMTRARKQLVLTAAQMRSRFGRTTTTGPSPLLDELGNSGVERYGEGLSSGGSDVRVHHEAYSPQLDEDMEDHPLAHMREGHRVFHADFGEGAVESIRGRARGLDSKVVILFDDGARRTLILRHAGLTLLDD